jgi:dienelactone hydrolase
MKIRKVEYFDGDVRLEATVASKKTEGKSPLIFVFHAWAGKDDFVEKKAVELANLGYVGCAIDLYGKGVLGKNADENEALMSPFMKDRSFLQKRILACLSLLPLLPEADVNQLGAIGYCFGGLAALDFARSKAGLKGVVSFHGLLTGNDSPLEPIEAKVLVLHGGKDPMVSSEDLRVFQEEMKDRKTDFQVHIFGNSMHAFTNPKANDSARGTVYDELSALRSWKLMRLFFEEVFH